MVVVWSSVDKKCVVNSSGFQDESDQKIMNTALVQKEPDKKHYFACLHSYNSTMSSSGFGLGLLSLKNKTLEQDWICAMQQNYEY